MIGFIYIVEPPAAARIRQVEQRMAGVPVMVYNRAAMPDVPTISTHWNTPAVAANDYGAPRG